MRTDPRVPLDVFRSAGLDASRFFRSDSISVRGPCWCGGHRRLAVWLAKCNYQCDVCGRKGFLINRRPDANTLAQMKAQAALAAERRDRERLARLTEYTSHELWNELHDRLTDDHRIWWENQGVPRDWQDYLKLGYDAHRKYRGQDGQIHVSPAYTIPFFHRDWTFKTIQFRLNSVQYPQERYRFIQGLGTCFYMSTPNQPLGDEVLVVEGAKKAMVAHIHGWGGCVLAVPSRSDFGGIQQAVADCGRCYILLDPDATPQAYKLGRSIGKSARVVELPVKVDDGLMQYGLTRDGLASALRYAKPVQ